MDAYEITPNKQMVGVFVKAREVSAEKIEMWHCEAVGDLFVSGSSQEAALWRAKQFRVYLHNPESRRGSQTSLGPGCPF
jgi:hypothetical protein